MQLQQPQILLADDSSLARGAIKRLLESQGLKVAAEAANGHEAVRIAEQLKPDLIILDWIMPEADGLEAARRILVVLPSVPIILNTLFATDQLAKSARQAGVKQVVSKMDGNLLIAAVKQLLPNRAV